MPQMSETVLAPELDGGQWIQHGPVSLKALRDNAVVLVDFWDYTCVNCIPTLPYVAAWNKRYGDSGLVIVGAHAPEFSFAREGSQVAEAAARFGGSVGDSPWHDSDRQGFCCSPRRWTGRAGGLGWSRRHAARAQCEVAVGVRYSPVRKSPCKSSAMNWAQAREKCWARLPHTSDRPCLQRLAS